MNEFEFQAPSPKNSNARRGGIVLLIVILIIGAGAATWFWQQREINRLRSNTQATITPTESIDDTNTTDPTKTAAWNQITLGPTFLKGDKKAEVSFKLPPAWIMVSCGGGDEALVAYIASPNSQPTTCGTEQISSITISAQVGDVRNSYVYSQKPTYANPKSEQVTIAAKDFQLNSGEVNAPMEFGPPKASTLASYVFFDAKAGVTYAATYIHKPTDEEDLSKQFKQIIEETLNVSTAVTTPTE